jgi:L-methionine (R)-S-oxide reductase
MSNTKELFDSLLGKAKGIIERASERNEKLLSICTLLKESVPHYDWVGFYRVEQESERELVLGPYVGEPTEHKRIPFGRGICGQAAEKEEMFVVQDISKEGDYLSCNSKVKSEIVVPIFKNGKIMGELDIDSHSLSAFTEQDKEFLEKVCVKVADLF